MPNVAVSVAVAVADTVEVETVNVVLVAPAAIVTLEGTVAETELDVRPTDAPPAGADPFSVSDPVVFEPPTTVDGETLKEVKVAGLTVMVADF